MDIVDEGVGNKSDCNSGNNNSGDNNIGNNNSGNGNAGNYNSGHSNLGDRNSGSGNVGVGNSGCRNSGDLNSGEGNTGSRNTGHLNPGSLNTGNYNAGNYNTGDRNAGSFNTGNSNSGSRNSGHVNSGSMNTGYGNTCDRITGIFCTKEPTVMCFDKPTNIRWEHIDHPHLELYQLTEWVQSSCMTEEEMEEHPEHVRTGGFTRKLTYKEMWAKGWERDSEYNKSRFLNLPNFDADKFFEITGIDVRPKKEAHAGKIVEIDGKKYELKEVE